MYAINKNKIVSSSPTLASKKDYISEMHQKEEISLNNGTKIDLREINPTKATCNGEKAQETWQEGFLKKNQNCDEVPVERKDKKTISKYQRKGSPKRRSRSQFTIYQKVSKIAKIFLFHLCRKFKSKTQSLLRLF